MKTGTRFGLVPYRGGAPALQDLIAGQIDLIFATAGDASALVRGGTIKAYAVMAKSRIAAGGIIREHQTSRDILQKMLEELRTTVESARRRLL
jgi:tripartite-type tricarboxylate transporter receptor subunit TctC